MGNRFGFRLLLGIALVGALAAVGVYTYNLGLAHGIAQSGQLVAAPGSGAPVVDLATAVGLRVRVLPVLPADDPVLDLRRARAILAWRVARTRLPLRRTARRAHGGDAACGRTDDVKHILVVDDEPRIAEIARDYLERAGFRGDDRRQRRRCAGARAHTPARSHRPRPGPAADGRPRRHAGAAQAVERADHHADGAGRRERQADRARARRRRLRDQAVQPEGARRARARGVPARRCARRSAATSSAPATSRSTCRGCRRASRIGTIDLTATEFELLATLARQPGRVFTRAQLLDAIRGEEVESFDRAIDAHIKNLRRKLEPDPRKPRYVLTVYGVGYKFADFVAQRTRRIQRTQREGRVSRS